MKTKMVEKQTVMTTTMFFIDGCGDAEDCGGYDHENRFQTKTMLATTIRKL